MDFGYWILHGNGIAQQKLEALPNWRNSRLFAPLERLVMEYAEAMTETPPTVDDELVKKLRVHLDEAQLVELTAVICLENVRSRFNSAVGLTPQGFKDRCEVGKHCVLRESTVAQADAKLTANLPSSPRVASSSTSIE